MDLLRDVPRHVFYDKLNELLDQGDFHRWIEQICEPFYAEKAGRPGIPPGVYFRMLFIGYFEGIDSQRGIAWRCADSRSLSAFLGFNLNERTPDHSSLSRIGVRIPLSVHEEVFAFVLIWHHPRLQSRQPPQLALRRENLNDGITDRIVDGRDAGSIFSLIESNDTANCHQAVSRTKDNMTETVGSD